MSKKTATAKLIDNLLVTDDVDQAFADYRNEIEALKEHPWVADLICVLWPHPSGLQRRLVLEAMRQRRDQPLLETPKEFDNTVQSAFQRHCGQSQTFKLGSDDDLFFWPNGRGAGIWAVNRERAAAWLRARNLPVP